MKRAIVLAGMLLAFAAGTAIAQDDKKPATGAAAQGTAAGQAEIQADKSGASATGKAASQAGAAAGSSSATLAQGTEINATLTNPVDAAKAKPGEVVTAKAAKDIRSGGKVVVPRGATLIGRVTRAQAHGSGAAGGASQLGIVFERALLKDGSAVAFNGAVAAIATARSAGSAGGGSMGATAGGGGGMATTAGGGLTGTVGSTVGGVTSATTGTAGSLGATVGATADAAVRSTGAVGGFDAAGGLKSGSRGVFGMRDFEIQGAAAGSAEGALVTSARRNVRLEGGTQLLLVAGGGTGGQAASPTRDPAPKPKQQP